MAAPSSLLTAKPLHGGDYGSFNWIFLIEYILCGILCLWFLFYFNRIFATLISYAVRLFTWHVFGVFVDIEALQVSILAGRVFFKGITYHGDNETIFIQGGYVTWRYWLRKVKPCRLFEERDSTSEGQKSFRSSKSAAGTEKADGLEDDQRPDKRGNLPCRIELRVSGIEAFIYNRGPAYDYILETCAQHGASDSTARTEAASTAYREQFGDRSASVSMHRADDAPSPSSASSSDSDMRERHADTKAATGEDTQSRRRPARYKPPSPPSILRLFPISVHCNKAAAVLGNENTPSILTAKIDSASGEFDASESGPLDVFKILMQFHVHKPFIQMKPNVDYKRPQLAEAALLEASSIDASEGVSKQEDKSKHDKWKNQPGSRGTRWTRFPGLSKRAMQSLESIVTFPNIVMNGDRLPDAHVTASGQGRWLGLARYLDDTQRKDEDEWRTVEYAKASTLADLNSVEFKFYWDIAGPRPPDDREADQGQALTTRNVNGGVPPGYGMELLVHGGTVHYGPWADRHRVFLQQLFFPAPFADAKAINRVAVGGTRLCTIFELFLSIEADTVLRIPFREPSKDYKWKGRAETMNKKQQDQPHHRRRRRNTSQTAHSTHARPYAWFDILVKPDTTIKYTQDMFPTLEGYKNDLRVDVGSLEMHSSLNHALLWHSGGVAVRADLSNPLKWNGLHEWTFEIGIDDLDFYLLRDHAVLLMDLIEDWTTGPLPEFFTFVPYRYILKPRFDRFRLFLNVNDANIVDQSDDVSDNDFTILYGRSLVSELLIPIDRFRPPQNTISFDVKAYDLGFELSMPPKNTLNAFLMEKDVAQLPQVDLKGAYVLCSEVQPGLAETLNMDIVGKGLRIAFYGFFARHLAKIKENYFGDDVHFRTLQEYQELVRNNFKSNEPQPPIRGNDLDVILDITAEDAHIMLPAGLYSCTECVELCLDVANVDLRVNNYYLELMVDSSPLELRHGVKSAHGNGVSYSLSQPQITIDSVNVYGHRLFGLPPIEPPYISNWDIDAGDILGQCSTEFISKVASAAQAVALTLTDEENGLPISEGAPLYDSTFVRWRSGVIRLWLQIQQEAFLFSTRDVHGSFNDRTTHMFSQHLVLDAPEIVLACATSPNLDAQPLVNSVQETLAYIKTTASVRMVQRAANFIAVQKGQADHITREDARTGRALFATGQKCADASAAPVSLCLPSLPGCLHSLDRQGLSHLVANDTSRRDVDAGVSLNLDCSKKVDDVHSGADAAAKVQKASGRSIFVMPALPRDASVIDLTDVPRLPRDEPSVATPASAVDASLFNNDTDSDSTHTSIRIRTDSGAIMLCKPRAILAASKVLEAMMPQDPEKIYDQYQMEVTSGVFSILRKQRGERSILDLGILVPFLHVRFINTQSYQSQEELRLEDNDEYNLVSSDSSVAVRVRTMPDRKHADDLKAVHLTVSSITLSAKQASESNSAANVAFESRISDILLWLADSDRTVVNASYVVFETKIASSELHYLAALIRRAADLAEQLALPFLTIQSINVKRRRYVVYTLAQAGSDVADPSFLTRPSYIIRSAQDHLRNNASWKIVARLRWILCRLNSEQRTSLWHACGDRKLDVPENAEHDTLLILDQWRSWDTLRVKDSLAMQLLFGSHTEIGEAQDPGSVPLSVNVRGSGLKMTIDHGHKQNSIILDSIAVAVSVTPPPPPSAMQLFKGYRQARLTVIHVSVADVSVNLNWELCNLVDDVMTLYEKSPFLQGSVVSPQTVMISDSPSSKNEDIHIVLQMDSAQTNVEALHVAQIVSGKDLKISIAGSGWQSPASDTLVTVVASSPEISTTTYSGSSLLLDVKLYECNLGVACEEKTESDSTMTSIHVGANTGHVDIDFHEEVAGFVEIAALVVASEAKLIHELVQRHHPALHSSATSHSVSKTTHATHANITLLLNSYSLNIPLVQDLRFQTKGRVLRLDVSPEHNPRLSHTANFDLKAQQHSFMRGELHAPLATSTLALPPINGAVRLLPTPSLVTLSTSIVVEQVDLDGLALYGIFSMLSSSGIVQAIETISDDIKTLLTTVNSTFPPSMHAQSRIATAAAASTTIIFDASLSLVGFRITSRTNQGTPTGSIGVVFDMDTTNFRASNRSPQGDKALPFPELCLTLGRMQTKVERYHEEELRKSAEITFGLILSCIVKPVESGGYARVLEISASGPSVELDEHAGAVVVDLLGHFRDRMKSLDLAREKRYLRRLRRPVLRSHSSDKQITSTLDLEANDATPLISTSVAFKLESAYVTYVIRHQTAATRPKYQQNLTLSLKQVQFRTRGEKEARLRIDEVKLQMLPQNVSWTHRSANSALLPELILTINHETSSDDRKLLFHAAGKALDVEVHPNCVEPAAELERSLSTSATQIRDAVARLRVQRSRFELAAPKLPAGTKRLSSLVVDTNFAGAIIRLREHDPYDIVAGNTTSLSSANTPGLGRYSNFSSDSTNKDATLRAPGIAIHVQYTDNIHQDPCLNLEVKIDQSKNVLNPTVVLLVLRVAHNVRDVMHQRRMDDEASPQETGLLHRTTVSHREPDERGLADESLLQRNPRALLGRARLNVGMRIARQELALVCQPIAKVEARMRLEDTYLTINTIDSSENDKFFAMSTAFTGMEASLQHVYSRDPTFRFDIESVIVSVMNSRHTSGTTGISAILKINPMKAQLNAKQLQDVLLFREIWLPPEIRTASMRNTATSSAEQQEYFATRYRQIATAAAFPWNATVAIADLGVELDLGQAIGKISAHITQLWASSKKTTSAQSTLCVGIEKVSTDAFGRMSGFVLLDDLRVRTSIAWPGSTESTKQTPLIQGSIGFRELRLKAAFDYQVFAIAYITAFEFIMYNVRDPGQHSSDRLVATLDGDKVHVYCVASTAALAVSLAQAFERLIQERKASYEQSLQDIDTLLRRKSAALRASITNRPSPPAQHAPPKPKPSKRLPISLQTDVVVSLGSMDVGAFPRTVMDNQILRLETSDVQARFAVTVEGHKLHTGLGLTLGQVRAALASVPHAGVPKAIGDIEIDEVVRNATSARGGIILRVPKVVASMQTWQTQGDRWIDYKFKSAFEGKIDVGWNYSRISFIRGMWTTHTRTLATRLGKPLPKSAVKITGPQPLPETNERGGQPSQGRREAEQSKITVTANVNLPHSGYVYRALEPAVIDAPQLRDMGEATPPLEWIGLHRDKLPNVTHQVVVMALLEIAKEVEDAYYSILG